MLSHGLGLISFVPSLAPSQEKVNNRGHFIFLLVVSSGDCMSWMLLQTPVFLVWKQPPKFQMQTSLQTACSKYRAQNIFYRPEHSQPHPPSVWNTPISGQSKDFSSTLIRLSRKVFYYLLSGFLRGFRLHYYGPYESRFSNNLVSASEHPDRVDQKLTKEI